MMLKTTANKKLTMEVQLTIIDNLGLNMYTSLAPVISEIVANSWDADARTVNIHISEGPISDASKIEIADNGTGMSFDRINEAFLQIGRKRREEEGTDETPVLHRKIMGRKGIGKLSVFGVAKKVTVDTCSEGRRVIFEMDIDAIRSTPKGQKYEPPFKESEDKGTKNGTTIILKQLKRKNAIDIKRIRQTLARMFSILGADFKIIINGKEITLEERNMRGKMEHVWDIDEKLLEDSELRVQGWVGTSETPLSDDTNGIIVMARGKLIQKPGFFGVTGGKEHARAYMTGELHAEFFDDAEDLMGTARNAIVLESEEGQLFQEWIQRKIRSISNEWSQKRTEKREKIVRDDPENKKWLGELSGQEKKLADKVIKAITADETLPKQRVLDLSSFMRESFEYQVFRDLATQISDTPTEQDTKLICLFEEWEFLRAKEMLRLFEGNLKTIEKLDQFIKTNAKEVPTIHKYFKEFPWVLDPRWTDYQDEVYYADLLRKKFPDIEKPEENRRIDFMAIGFGDTVHVIELKRPGTHIGKGELQQIEDYVLFIRSRLAGTDPHVSYHDAAGYLICEEMVDAGENKERIKNLEKNRIYIRQYSELLSMARRLHQKYIELYEALKLKYKKS